MFIYYIIITRCFTVLKFSKFYTEFFLLIYLKKIKATTNNFCNFYKEESETIEHVFVNCKHILPLWGKLSMHMLRYTGKRIVFHVIIFYLVKLLLAKITKLWILSFYIQNNTFIYAWNKKRIPTLCELIHFFKLKYKIENYASIQKL